MDNQETPYYRHIRGETVTQLLLRYLQLEKTDKIFGIPGKPIQHILDEIQKRPEELQYVVCRHEGGATYIADGYARTSGRLGVVLVTSGPGASNTLTGLLNAQCGQSSVLVIAGEVPEARVGMGHLQDGYASEINTCAVFRAITPSSVVVSHPNNFPTLMGQAIRDSMATPKRASFLSIPEGIASEVVDDVRFPKAPENLHPVAAHTDRAGTRKVLDALVRAERPLLFVGNGCRQALGANKERHARFAAFVERYSLPVMTSSDGKGVFDETHRLSLRHYGAASCPWPAQYMEQREPNYDALLVLGSTLGQWGTANWHSRLIPDGPFMQVDLNQGVFARCFPVSLGVVAELGAFIDDLCSLEATVDRGAAERRLAFVDRLKKDTPPFVDGERRSSTASPLPPQALMRVLGDALPAESHVFIDAGNCVGWSLHHLTLRPPTQFHINLAMGPMGFGVCGVIGGKIGAPQTTCVAIVGDGAFLMHGSEVSTAAQYGVGAIWIVLADDDMSMVSQGMHYLYPKTPNWNEAYRLGRADVALFAKSLGAEVYEAHDATEAKAAIEKAVAHADRDHRPQVVVARIDRSDAPPYYPPKR